MDIKKPQKSDELIIEDTCLNCRNPLPPGSLFCEVCGPPKLPPEDIEEGLSRGQAAVRIILIVGLFLAVLSFKLDWKMDEIIPEIRNLVEQVNPADIPQDQDYKVFHTVNVELANVRNSPDLKSKVIAQVKQGDRVVILEKNEGWTKISIDGKTGWISSELLTGTIE